MKGKYSSALGATAASQCNACPAGKRGDPAALGTDSGHCTPCTEGTYQGEAAKKTCSKCPAGSASGIGEIQCGECFAGKILTTTGNSSGGNCTNCLAGRYSKAKTAACLLCEPGKSSRPGDPICTACKPGTYRGWVRESEAGDRGLPDGKGGEIGSTAQSGKCLNCTAGRYSVAEASVCAPCAAGQYLASTNGAQCKVRACR